MKYANVDTVKQIIVRLNHTYVWIIMIMIRIFLTSVPVRVLKRMNEMKSTKEKGTEAEKYIANMLREMGHLADVHPRTSRPIKGFYISQENDYFNAFDIIAFAKDSVVLAQVTDTKEADNPKIVIAGGNVSKRMSKIDANFPVHNPHVNVILFLTQKRWVKVPGQTRHKEYFYRAWRREIVGDKTVWVERKALSKLPEVA